MNGAIRLVTEAQEDQTQIGRDDAARRLREALAARFPRGRTIDVRRAARSLVVSGEVASYYEKQLVQEIARRTSGAMRVVNALFVRPKPGTAEWITRPMPADGISA